MSSWLSARELAGMQGIDDVSNGREALHDILRREPEFLFPVNGPGTPPLDPATYRARYERWRDGAGPDLHGIEAFMKVLERGGTPTCAVSIEGKDTNYVLILDGERTTILGGVAVDLHQEEDDDSQGGA